MSVMAPPAPLTVVHDFAYVLAGAERVSTVLANEVAPGSRLVAISGSRDVLERMHITGGARSLLPGGVLARVYRALAPVYPVLLRMMPVIEGDVLCSSYAFAHHVRCTGRKVVYCHTPLRQIWSGNAGYLAHASGWQRLLLRALTSWMRRSDLRAVSTADTYVAVSGAVRQRIEGLYGRSDVVVVPPPLDTGTFRPDRPRAGDRRHSDGCGPSGRPTFLWVGRIVEPYKRLSLVVEAFRGLPYDLVVAGEGRDRARLEAGAPANVRFLGWQDDAALAELYRGARAVVFPSEDDFGLVPVESMACGTPSVAYRRGGACETVVEGVTGVFFDEQDVPSLRAALLDAASRRWDRREIAERGRAYGAERFVHDMREVLRSA